MPTSKTKPTQIHKTEPKPKPTLLRAELTPIQERIADLLGDLILNGGNDANVDGMLYNALEYHWRRMFADRPGSSDSEDNEAQKFADGHLNEWKRELVQSWPKREDKAAAGTDPKTVTDYIRAEVRHQLEFHWDWFLSSATPEEIRFMDMVLMDWDSTHTSSFAYDPAELEIGNSFEREINRGVRWVKVPHELRDKVVDFVELLTKPIKAA